MFFVFSDPTPPSDKNLPLIWKPSTKEALNFLNIDKELKMGPISNPKRYQFWKDIYRKYRQTSSSFYSG